MLLGSGELGKEFVISVKRLGCYVIAVDSYERAPAMQVADKSVVCDMLNAEELRYAIDFYKPDIIVPEIEAIRTEVLKEFEDNGIQVVPSAKAVNATMNRDTIRNIAAGLGHTKKTVKILMRFQGLDGCTLQLNQGDVGMIQVHHRDFGRML